MKPSRRSWRMPASTSGKPVRPSVHASNASSSSLPLERSAVARLELLVRVVGVMEQQLLVEVAPAELAAKRLRALAARQPLLQLARRDAAEAQVGREPRGAVAPERVVVVGVVAHAVARGSATSARGRRPRPRASARRPPARGRASRATGIRPLARPGRQRRQLARRRPHLAPGLLGPAPVVGREDGVRLSLLGPDLAGLVDRREPRMRAQLHAGVPAAPCPWPRRARGRRATRRR